VSRVGVTFARTLAHSPSSECKESSSLTVVSRLTPHPEVAFRIGGPENTRSAILPKLEGASTSVDVTWNITRVLWPPIVFVGARLEVVQRT